MISRIPFLPLSDWQLHLCLNGGLPHTLTALCLRHRTPTRSHLSDTSETSQNPKCMGGRCITASDGKRRNRTPCKSPITRHPCITTSMLEKHLSLLGYGHGTPGTGALARTTRRRAPQPHPPNPPHQVRLHERPFFLHIAISASSEAFASHYSSPRGTKHFYTTDP